MMKEMLLYSKWIEYLNDQKPAFKNSNTPYFIASRIVDESKELQEAIYQDADAFPVGREIGDVLFLTFLLCAELGFDPRDLLDLTIKRNEIKYNRERLQVDDNGESIRKLKQEWKDKGDDLVWSHTLDI